MGAIESLDHCCADRPNANKKYIGSWKAPQSKTQNIDLNTDRGNGAPICDDPLKDLKLDKSIDSEMTIVFKEIGHRFPCPINGQEQLMKVLAALKKRGYFFPGTDEKLCARVWAMHHCSRITILQFRAWFHAEVVVSAHNLRVLLGHSRWVSTMMKRIYSESEDADDKMELICNVVNTLRQYLEEDPISSAEVHATFDQVIDKKSKTNYLINGLRKILKEDFEALVKELLVELYFDHFSASLYSNSEEEAHDAKKVTKLCKLKQLAGSSACCLPTSVSGMDRWRNVSETLPCGFDDSMTQKSNKVPGTALPLGDDNRALARSLKFPVGAAAA